MFSPNNWGLSIAIKNGVIPGSPNRENNGFISSSIAYENENPITHWLTGIQDTDREDPTNWILSGTSTASDFTFYNDAFVGPPTNRIFMDPNEAYESIIGGIIAPYRLVRWQQSTNRIGNTSFDVQNSSLDRLFSFIMVITNDKSKWTRCPVIETSDENNGLNWGIAKVNNLSIDKEGNPVDTTGFGNLTMAQIATQFASTNEEDAGFVSATGMGWFPGYVLNKETGERLNIVYGEDSRYSINNGNDMQWNPNSVINEGVNPQFVNQIWGGKHLTYIFRETEANQSSVFPPLPGFPPIPQYDNGLVLRDYLGRSSNNFRRLAWSFCSYVLNPLLVPGTELLATDVQIDVNINRPFAVKDSELEPSLDNNGKPVYRFRTQGVAVSKQQKNVLADRLKDINVVPNPYRGMSEYELDQLDNTVKFTNLPEQATIRIYNMNGTLIRTYNKANPQNFLDWDLKNQVGIPIASGVYLIHVNVPGVGEKILKWFGVLRPVDLNNF